MNFLFTVLCLFGTPALPPAAPSNAAATTDAPARIIVTWNDNSGDELGFSVERMRHLDGTWAPAAIVAPDTTTWADTSVAGNTRYDYRVLAFNASGASPSVRAFAVTHVPRIPLPTGFAIGMPIVEAEIGSAHLRLLPFGVHQFTSPSQAGNHPYDGHPGWDIEFAQGGSVRSAAAGTVQSVTGLGTSWVVQVQHQIVPVFRRTVYNGLASVAAGIVPGVSVARGQVLGAPRATTQIILGAAVTSWTFHFQLDDYGVPPTTTGANDQSVDPYAYLDFPGRAVFGTIWKQATWREEIVEPFTGQPRVLNPFPLTRTWARKSGTHAARIDFRHQDPATTQFPEYSLHDENGILTESGTVEIFATPGYATLDLRPTQSPGSPRRARYDILGGSLHIDYGAPGASRPPHLGWATDYVSP